MQKNKAVVVLSPEQMDIHQTLLHNKMKEVEESIKIKPPIISNGAIVANEQSNELTLVTAQGR